jgi:hypothetical protein
LGASSLSVEGTWLEDLEIILPPEGLLFEVVYYRLKVSNVAEYFLFYSTRKIGTSNSLFYGYWMSVTEGDSKFLISVMNSEMSILPSSSIESEGF